MKWGGLMAKTSRPQNTIREYKDVPLSPDFSLTGDDFVEHLMKQLPPIPDHLKTNEPNKND
ncbi:hypothetical protein SAMN05444162_0121 [Paenibacillaceae bacterium GAS479]|nr:hypothetical protein SAMN05444162_0121 [Paenibacillaceae bacterium GAS479]